MPTIFIACPIQLALRVTAENALILDAFADDIKIAVEARMLPFLAPPYGDPSVPDEQRVEGYLMGLIAPAQGWPGQLLPHVYLTLAGDWQAPGMYTTTEEAYFQALRAGLLPYVIDDLETQMRRENWGEGQGQGTTDRIAAIRHITSLPASPWQREWREQLLAWQQHDALTQATFSQSGMSTIIALLVATRPGEDDLGGAETLPIPAPRLKH